MQLEDDMALKPKTPENLPFLTLQEFHLSKTKAVEAVVTTLKQCGVERPKAGWDTLILNWKDGQGQTPVSFDKLVGEMRRIGGIKRLQRWLDKRDAVFGGTIGETATSNHKMKWKCASAGWTKEAQGPCRTSCVEQELMEDILDYRRLTCEYSDEYDFRLTCRFFRAYLSACVSLVDAFINRHALLAEHDGFMSPELDELKRTTNMDDRIRLWFAVCSDEDPAGFLASSEWCHFQEIRMRRNALLHATEPISVYAIKDLQVYLNKVRTGIGQMLLRLRTAHQKPALLFIERLRTAPLVDFHRIQFRGDGNHVVKRIQGK